MRTVYVDLSSDICIKPIFAGYEGEHNATQLTVKIPNRMIINNVDYYTFCFELPTGECIESDGYAFQYLNNGELSLYLPKQIMVRGDIIVAINAYCVTTDESTSETTVNLLEKTSEIRLFIENSPNGRYTKYDDRELSNIVWEFVNIQSVLYNEKQNLTNEQKTTARKNIDAVDANLVVSSILDSSAHPRDVKIPNGAALFEYVADYSNRSCVRNDVRQEIPAYNQELARSNIGAVSQAELGSAVIDKVSENELIGAIAATKATVVSAFQQQNFTDEQKQMARTNIDAVGKDTYELIESIVTTEECQQVTRTAEPDGTAYAFTKCLIRVAIPATTAAATVSMYISTSGGAWLAGYYKSSATRTKGTTYYMLEAYQSDGIWKDRSDCGNTYSSATMTVKNISDASYATIGKVVVSLSTTGVNLPVGTTIEIYGVRA